MVVYLEVAWVEILPKRREVLGRAQSKYFLKLVGVSGKPHFDMTR